MLDNLLSGNSINIGDDHNIPFAGSAKICIVIN